jgi:hypothetical protein
VIEDQRGFQHRQPVGATAYGPIMAIIREAENVLVQMAAVAHAAENGDADALKKISAGGKQMTHLMAKLTGTVQPTATTNGADQADQSTKRISPRTGRPMRKYVRHAATA